MTEDPQYARVRRAGVTALMLRDCLTPHDDEQLRQQGGVTWMFEQLVELADALEQQEQRLSTTFTITDWWGYHPVFADGLSYEEFLAKVVERWLLERRGVVGYQREPSGVLPRTLAYAAQLLLTPLRLFEIRDRSTGQPIGAQWGYDEIHARDEATRWLPSQADEVFTTTDATASQG